MVFDYTTALSCLHPTLVDLFFPPSLPSAFMTFLRSPMSFIRSIESLLVDYTTEENVSSFLYNN